MFFKTVIVFIVSIFFLVTTYMTSKMFIINMPSKLILVKEILGTEITERMHEGNIAELVSVSSLLMFGESLIGIELMLFEDTSLFLNTKLTIYFLMYHRYRLWSSLRCFLRKLIEVYVFYVLQGCPFDFTKHLYSVSRSKAILHYSEVWRISEKFLSPRSPLVWDWNVATYFIRMIFLRPAWVK